MAVLGVFEETVPTNSGDDEKPFNVINNVVFHDIFILFSSCWLSKNAARMPPTHVPQATINPSKVTCAAASLQCTMSCGVSFGQSNNANHISSTQLIHVKYCYIYVCTTGYLTGKTIHGLRQDFGVSSLAAPYGTGKRHGARYTASRSS